MSFTEDLERGKSVEMKILQKIQNKFPCATWVKAHKGYDIWIPEKGYGVEVKYDQKSNETGNIVVEIEMFGKPSALFTTEAKWWVFYDDTTYAWIKPIDIIKCIIFNKLIWVEFVGQGDTAIKKAYLIKKELLFSYAKTEEEEYF
jgi:hypothetical protein